MGWNFKKDIKKNAEDIEQLKKQVQELEERQIVDDLLREKFTGNPLYTYEEIAQKNNTNATRVCRIAKENGLSRRKSKKTS